MFEGRRDRFWLYGNRSEVMEVSIFGVQLADTGFRAGNNGVVKGHCIIG